MRWLETRNDGLVNSDHVVELRPDYMGCHTTAYLKDGKTIALSGWFTSEDAGEVIPAHPGFKLLAAYENDPEDGDADVFIGRYPVIAWRVGSELVPVAYGFLDGCCNLIARCVLSPEGRCFNLDIEWENETKWRAYVDSTLAALVAKRRDLARAKKTKVASIAKLAS